MSDDIKDISDIKKMVGVKIKSNNENPLLATAENKIGSRLKTIGETTLVVGIVLGFIIGLALTTPDPEYASLTVPNPMRWVYGIPIIITSFISGISFLGFGEIINLLDKINKNTSK